MLTHIPVTDQAVKATRKTTGLTEGSHCNVCGEVLEEQEVTPTILPGDADSNREIDGRDAIRMMKKLRETGTECDEDAGDVDQNGRMNEKDVQIMMQYLGGENVALQ